MPEILFGVETEYALFGAAAEAVDLVEAIRRRHPWLPDRTECGAFLANGSRLYIDCGRHPELATPECRSPWELVACLRAGDRLLERALEELAGEWGALGRMELTRCNVDYSGSGSTWGSHESYLHRASAVTLGVNLLPHLVSRLVYCGAGGFDPLSPGIEFTLSPRAGFLVRQSSKDSTTVRGLLHSKNEALAHEGMARLHLLCGESLCSDEATLLRVGTTALIVALVDGGARPGEAIALADPLAALRSVAGDPSASVRLPLARGGVASALDIQRHYLERVEASAAAGKLPAWAPAICARWRRMLDRLDEGPEAVATTLDWAIKWRLFLHRCGARWSRHRLAAWTRVLRGVGGALTLGENGSGPLHDALRSGDPAQLEALDGELVPRLTREGLERGELAAFLALRAELLEADFRFAQLGPRGVFTQLDRAGVVAHAVISDRRIERAVTSPPPQGRARVRGAAVAELGGPFRSRYLCDWAGIYDRGRSRLLDLGDPFASQAAWRSADQVAGERRAVTGTAPVEERPHPNIAVF